MSTLKIIAVVVLAVAAAVVLIEAAADEARGAARQYQGK